MSVISSLNNATFTVKRKAAGTSTNSRLDIYADSSTGNRGCIRIVSDVAKIINKSDFGYEYDLWCARDVDLLADDILSIVIDSNSGTTGSYIVKSVIFVDDLEGGEESHKKATILKQNTNTDD